MAQRLVQISDMKRPDHNVPGYYNNWPQRGHRILRPVEVANLPRPQAILDLVQALTNMFGRIGMAEVCRSCWNGELNNSRKGQGCCGRCPLIGHRACLAKPLGCALFMCWDQTKRLWPRTHEFLEFIRYRLHRLSDNSMTVGCYPSAVYSESRVALSPADELLVHALVHAVNSWEEACRPSTTPA
jgi:hypothetical protein